MTASWFLGAALLVAGSPPAGDLPPSIDFGSIYQEKADPAPAAGPAEPAAEQPEVPVEPEGSPATSDDPAKVLFPGSFPERLFDSFAEFKKAYCFPFSFAAWHWQHQNNDGPLRSGYGIPTIRGTYWWSIYADPEIDLNGEFIQKAGVHTELRLREQDQFRSFFTEKVWLWENYAWVETPYGRFKGGQIWKRLGLDWDGVFFGNVPYFDGYKLDPDYGLSWEQTWKVRDDFKVDSFVQYFFHDDGINGTIEGADPESLAGSHERNTGVVRLVPTWTFTDKSTLALGVSGLVGQIDNNPEIGVSDQVVSAWAVDATYTRKQVKVFAEVLQSYGVFNPARYTSGGPSNRCTDVLAGIHYVIGPATLRFSYSAGFDENPSGWQQLWLPGVTIALTKNIDFYAEWTRWDVFGNPGGSPRNGHVEFEDGYSFVINWRF